MIQAFSNHFFFVSIFSSVIFRVWTIAVASANLFLLGDENRKLPHSSVPPCEVRAGNFETFRVLRMPSVPLPDELLIKKKNSPTSLLFPLLCRFRITFFQVSFCFVKFSLAHKRCTVLIFLFVRLSLLLWSTHTHPPFFHVFNSENQSELCYLVFFSLFVLLAEFQNCICERES